MIRTFSTLTACIIVTFIAISLDRTEASKSQNSNSGFEAHDESVMSKQPTFNNFSIVGLLQNGRVPAFVGSDRGDAFFVTFESNVLSTVHIRTSRPVFKAFGFLSGAKSLVYTPLLNRNPSGTLVVEDLQTGIAQTVTDDLIIEVQVSPDETTIAYTFATDEGFGLATVNPYSGKRELLVPAGVVPDFLYWDDSGDRLYFLATSESDFLPREVLLRKGTQPSISGTLFPEYVPSFPTKSTSLSPSHTQLPDGHLEVRYPFEQSTPDRSRRICGSDLFGNSTVSRCNGSAITDRSILAVGQLLRILNEGIIVRSFGTASSTTHFVDWNGIATNIATSPLVTYNKPMSSFLVTQGGSSYAAPGNCQISSHTGSLSFAYDMQNSTAGKHVLASAEGLVINVNNAVTCNSGSASCADFQSNCANNGGWGNTVIIQHSDGSYSRYAHLQHNSIQVALDATACQGLYLGNQGHTGNTCCTSFNGCGDHLHFQKQSTVSGSSISVTFSDAASNPLSCSSQTSGSSEVTTCTTCVNGNSTLLNRDGGPPIHPPGSVIKSSSSSTVYLIDMDGRKRAITSAAVLAQLYNQATDPRSGTNFTNWVITVDQNELDMYEQGGNLSAAQPTNNMPFPDGKLIGFDGEISIVTGGGKRRPFSSGPRFTGLGFQFCQVVNVSQSEYNSYPEGPPVDAMPLLTQSVNLSPGPYTVGQSITGNFTIKNVGYDSVTFSNLGIGGRFDSMTVYDMNFVTRTLAPGEIYTFNSQPRQLTNAGTYNFFAAYQEVNEHWTTSVTAVSGVVRSRQISVGNPACPSPNPISSGQTVTGNLANGDCLYTDGSYYDAYTFNGTAGQQIYITMNSSQFNAFLFLFQGSYPGGNQIASNNDGGGGTNARIPPATGSITLPTSGIYTILANSFASGETGGYSMFLGNGNPGTLQFSSSSYNVSETAGTATVTVIRSGGTSPTSVSYATSNGTAAAGVDYAAANGTLNFGEGELSKTFTVSIIDDALVEGDETVNLALSSPTGGATIGSPSLAVLTINDNDGSCTFLGNPSSRIVTSATGNNSFQIMTQPGCAWTVSINSFLTLERAPTDRADHLYSMDGISHPLNLGDALGIRPIWNVATDREAGNWLTINSPTSGSGESQVNYNYTSNSGSSSRTATVLVNGLPLHAVTQSGVNNRKAFDYDGDGKSDISVFRPTDGGWYLLRSGSGFLGIGFGFSTDKIVPADYDGDGKTDVAVYRPSNGVWYILNSSNFSFTYYYFGTAEDLPAPADHDGDGKADLCVFRPSTGTWYRQLSSNGAISAVQFGANGDKPTVGDFDGDGKADLALFRPSAGAWYRLNSSNGAFVPTQFGLSTDLTVPADYDGDGKTDIAVYRAAIGYWYLLNSSNGAFVATNFGLTNDVPAPGDFDGDGRADLCVFRPSDASWYRLNSANGGFFAQQFGANGDRPTPAAFRF